jgi:hypothetical protein
MVASFLTPEALEEPHTAKDYLQWARSLVQKLKAEPDGLGQIRLRIGLAKELMEEVIPIGLLASHYFDESEEVQINLKIGNQNYDATVSDTRVAGPSVSYLEVTLAHEGETEYLRMRQLHKKGKVSALGSVTKRGTRRTRLIVKIANEMVSQPEILRRERDLVSKAIDRKLNKPYPPKTLLIIGFDDTMAFDRGDNIANLKDVLIEYMPKLKAFHSVAIVGLYKELFLCMQTSDAI